MRMTHSHRVSQDDICRNRADADVTELEHEKDLQLINVEDASSLLEHQTL